MPEGDTVWRTARSLDRALTGHPLIEADLRVPDLATVDLVGRVVTGTHSRGKHLMTRLGDDLTLHTHLKMEGSWHLYRPGSAWRRPAYEARVVLRTEGWTAVGFALGVVELLAREREEEPVAHLGPDLLGPDWDAEEAVRRLARAPDRPVIEALVDQACLAGVGNMYAAELCFLAGVRPDRPVGDVGDLGRVVTQAHRLLVANRERAQQTTTGDLRPGRQLWVYRRDKASCRRCGTRIRVAMRGEPGRERASVLVPDLSALTEWAHLHTPRRPSRRIFTTADPRVGASSPPQTPESAHLHTPGPPCRRIYTPRGGPGRRIFTRDASRRADSARSKRPRRADSSSPERQDTPTRRALSVKTRRLGRDVRRRRRRRRRGGAGRPGGGRRRGRPARGEPPRGLRRR